MKLKFSKQLFSWLTISLMILQLVAPLSVLRAEESGPVASNSEQTVGVEQAPPSEPSQTTESQPAESQPAESTPVPENTNTQPDDFIASEPESLTQDNNENEAADQTETNPTSTEQEPASNTDEPFDSNNSGDESSSVVSETESTPTADSSIDSAEPAESDESNPVSTPPFVEESTSPDSENSNSEESDAELAPSPEMTSSATLTQNSDQTIWKDNENGSKETIENVVIEKEYTAPQNDKVKVKFNILPEGSGKLTIKEVKLTAEQIEQTGALSDTAYEITSTMADGTFEYDLTLPLPENVQSQDVEIKSAENVDQLDNAEKVEETKEENAPDTITIKSLNHFTVFVVTTPSPDTTQRVLINEALPVPSAGGEWIELFNNGTTAVNLGAGAGWTIKNSANATFSLASLGTIPAAGRVVFEVIPGAGLLSDVAPETITLINELGSTIDTVTINLTAPGFAIDHYPLAGESVGRETDGIDRWVIFTSPSKGTANAIPVPATGFVEVGPVAPAGGLMAGFPSWYKDSNGIALDLHEAPDGGFSISDPPDPANPFSQTLGFNAEGFWWSAEASIDRPIGTRAILVLALEATFAGEAAVDGEQSVQNRLRYRIDGLVPGETYTITHPFGQVDEIADADGVINVTDDTGCFAGGGVTCNQTATPNFSTPLSGQVGPFLTWTTFNTNPTLTDPQLSNPANPSRRYVGNPAVGHAVTGSPTGNNLFRVQGLNVGGPGVNSIETALFTVSGRLADANAPVITLFGANPVNVIQGAVYTDAGATALDDQGGNLTGSMQVAGLPVDTATLGEKTVTYTVADGASRTTVATRIVNVIAAGGVDTTAPVITLNGAASVDVVQGTVYTDLGATCLDDTDGNCTASIVTVNPVNTANLGAQLITYNFTDTAGNPAVEVTRIVNVVADTIPPVITILGSNVVNILTGATYADDGAIATDNVNGSVTANIVSTGLPVDTTIIRENTVTYTVTDSAGNTATATRTVNVVATLPAGLSAVSAINPDNGYPTWYKDSAGIAIQLCLAGADGLADGNCTLPGAGEEPNFNPALPVSFPDNFPGEAFWYLAEPDVVTNAGQTGQGRVRFRYALESAFTTEAPTPNEQIAFLRVNMQPIADLVPGATYTVTHPFGSFTVHAGDALLEDGVTPNPSAGVADDGRFFRVEDGAFAPPLTEVTAASILPAANTGISTFLKQANPLPPAGYIGDGATLSTIEAGPNGNFVRVEGPGIDVNNYDGDGNPDSLTIDTWTVSGKLADITPPVITVTGANPDTVTQGTAYTDPGATCSDDFDGNCTGLMITNGLPVNTATLDPKTITYSYADRSGNAGSAQRIVNVVAAGPDITAPVITLNGANPFEVAEGTVYVEPGATALDLGGDGDISANIAIVSNVPAGLLTLGTGPFTVTYNVSDAAGNAAVEVVRIVNVIAAPVLDTVAPVITLTGAPSVTVDFGAIYNDDGATASDDVSGIITASIVTVNPVNTSVAGIYTVTYNVSDAAGNAAAQVTRTVIVNPAVSTTGTISGLVFNDVDADRVKDAGESVQAGWMLFLDTNNNRVLDAGEVSTLSDVSGNYQFEGLNPGAYIVNEVVQPGWAIRLPGNNGYTQAVIAGDNIIGKDFGNIATQTVGGQGQGGFATTTGTNLTTSVVALGDVLINVSSSGGTSTVTLPADTVITESTGAVFDASALAAFDPASTEIQGLGTGTVVNGKLRWGVNGLGLVFSNPITLNIFVGTALDGQTLDILRSVDGTTNWTGDGIAGTKKCAVVAGICSFQATQASYYVAVTLPAAQTTSSLSSNSDSGLSSVSDGLSSVPSAPVCNDTNPGSVPTLISAITTGPNEVLLTWSQALDPVTYYLVAYGTEPGLAIYGNPNVGDKNTTSYKVSGLSGGTTYYFKVRAGNNCMPGVYSNELAATPAGITLAVAPASGFIQGVLGASTEDESQSESGVTAPQVLGAEIPGQAATPQVAQSTLMSSLLGLALPVLVIMVLVTAYFRFVRKPVQ